MKTLTNLNFKKIICLSVGALFFAFALCTVDTLSSYATDVQGASQENPYETNVPNTAYETIELWSNNTDNILNALNMDVLLKKYWKTTDINYGLGWKEIDINELKGMFLTDFEKHKKVEKESVNEEDYITEFVNWCLEDANSEFMCSFYFRVDYIFPIAPWDNLNSLKWECKCNTQR